MEVVKFNDVIDEVEVDEEDAVKEDKPKLGQAIARFVLSESAAIGAYSIASRAIRAVVPAPAKLPAKILFGLGTCAIASIVGDLAAEEMLKTYDSICITIQKFNDAKNNDDESDEEDEDNDD